MMNLREPVKAKQSDNYLAVLEDTNGTVHFWLPDGTYDGYCRSCTDEKETDTVNRELAADGHSLRVTCAGDPAE